MRALPVFQDFLARHKLPVPSYHVVLGSGYGTALESFPWEKAGDLSFRDMPGFPPSTVQDHAGSYRFFRKGSHSICFQMGRIHGYEGHPASAVIQPVMVPRLAGVRNFVLTNAAGGLSAGYKPGDVMLIRDHVNLTGLNPLVGVNPTGPDGKEIGPRFPDLAKLYCRELRARMKKHLEGASFATHEGVYLGLLGPSFETPAEIQLFASWGLNAVGMSTVWEAIALAHSGARVGGISLISNLGAGMGEGTLDHGVILETCRASASHIVRGIQRTVEEELGL
jgi:purine-nucleoside phosphorylase